MKRRRKRAPKNQTKESLTPAKRRGISGLGCRTFRPPPAALFNRHLQSDPAQERAEDPQVAENQISPSDEVTLLPNGLRPTLADQERLQPEQAEVGLGARCHLVARTAM